MAIDPRTREASKHIGKGHEHLDEALGLDGIDPTKLRAAAWAFEHAARILEGKVRQPPGGTETEGDE